MLNLAKLKIGILLVLLVGVLLPTLGLLADTSPVFASPAQPNLDCEINYCEDAPQCIITDPPATVHWCNNACWLGTTLRCMDFNGWKCGTCPWG